MGFAKKATTVVIAWIFWLIILPYPFLTYTIRCAANGTNCLFVDVHQWAWFGGYHIFIEHIFFFETIDHLYLGFTYPGAAAYACISLLFALLSFVGVKRMIFRKKNNTDVAENTH